MADDDSNIGLLVAGGVGLYLLASGKLSGLFGPKGNAPSAGPPIKAPSSDNKTAAAVGGAICSAVGGAAAGSLCAAAAPTMWGGAKAAFKNPGAVVGSILDPLALFGGNKMTAEQVAKWNNDLSARGGTPPTGCGGWKGACPSQTTEAPLPPAPAPAAFTGPTFKPSGFR